MDRVLAFTNKLLERRHREPLRAMPRGEGGISPFEIATRTTVRAGKAWWWEANRLVSYDLPDHVLSHVRDSRSRQPARSPSRGS